MIKSLDHGQRSQSIVQTFVISRSVQIVTCHVAVFVVDVTLIIILQRVECGVRAVAGKCSGASLFFFQGFSQKSSYDSLLLQDGPVLLNDKIGQHFLLFSQIGLQVQQGLNVIKMLDKV